MLWLCGLASEQFHVRVVDILKTRFVIFSLRLANHFIREAAQIEEGRMRDTRYLLPSSSLAVEEEQKNAVIFGHKAVSSPCHVFKEEIIYAILSPVPSCWLLEARDFLPKPATFPPLFLEGQMSLLRSSSFPFSCALVIQINPTEVIRKYHLPLPLQTGVQ